MPTAKKLDALGNYELTLFVSGNTALSARAIVNIRSICETHLKGRYTLEIVDLTQTPERASQAEIIALPTLVKSNPRPLRRFIGDLSDPLRLLHGLDIDPQKEFA